jgi:hypothetical protein
MVAASANASVRVVVGRTDWEAVHHVGNGGVQSEVSRRVLAVHIHDCGAILGGVRPAVLRCYCVSRVARVSTDAVVEERRGRRRLAVHHRE